jgi:hypothetical protein
MIRSITSKITQFDERYVTIETVEMRPGFEPFRTSVDIEHNGDPEEVHRGYHELIAGNASEARKPYELTKQSTKQD